MSAALLLAGQGLGVTLVEKAPRLAPLVRGFRRSGVHFDTGFHHTGYLAPGEALDRIFTFMGLAGLDSFPLGLHGDQRVAVDGGPEEGYLLPSGFGLVLDTLSEAFPADRGGLRAYLEAVRDAQESSPYLAGEDAGVGNARYASATLAEVLDELISDARLKTLLSSQALYHGVPPAKVSFIFHSRVGAAGLRSLHGVRGGGETLTRAFEQALASAGIAIVTGAGLTEITLSPDGVFRGARLDNGQLIEADSCVCTVHPSLLAGLVPEGAFRPAYRNRLSNLPESPRPVMVFGMLQAGRAEPGSSRIILNGHDPTGWFAQSKDGRPGAVSFMASPSQGTGGEAPFELASCGEDHSPVEAMIESFTRSFPELASGARFLDSARPSTFARYANSPHGSYYGAMHTIDSRPPQPRTKIAGLYLAGQALVAPGVAGACISACVTADVLLGSNAVLKGISRC